ncbi:MAG: hypothetical protein ACREX8_14325 [Gammaproteobacteria bacterium]
MAWQAHCDYPNETWWGTLHNGEDDDENKQNALTEANAHNNEYVPHSATAVPVND